MHLNTSTLLNELKELTLAHISFAENLKSINLTILNQRLTPDSWSILECLEHLNRYGSFYHPQIEQKIASSNSKPQSVFKPGWLGNYFANAMLPKEKLNKMKTFKSLNPINSVLNQKTITTFLTQQNQLLNILTNAEKVNLNSLRITTSISSIIKLKLGDTLRVIIYHNKRHIVQAQKVLEGIADS
ncbi:DinB family protein [Flavobacterium sp. xlx-214]|uniref:DinB family protein n=1 Tax=unclassified Flavobacterium TaxID=196869 RepID=UPI0013D8A212|nr:MULTISPECIES: DinB family protein [unclassified Flavobacterium]MBA5793563.1 DinB family protein [Flavobacterium sp. xlx-221]QMI84493.1 DinB family protein [Flavobacterium sp. xlx-214]